jgi:NAD(P)-dependent dehydrogenase (short-subunit alcohol dehydrogenase family)
MRRIVVTGANKGIGLAIARAILAQHEDTFVLLGARDPDRGQAAVRTLVHEDASWSVRVAHLSIDVARDESVAAAARLVEDRFGRDAPLYALVNNAGLGSSGNTLREILEVNTYGVRRTCEAFVPLLDPASGRVVNVTSASGPSFVARCSPERQRFFVSPDTDWPALDGLLRECLAIAGDEAAFTARGLADGEPYGLSKACANTYTQHLARRYPSLRINACTPGFIETDMTRHYAEEEGKAPAELGMKPPSEGTRAPLFLLFGELEGNGRYYGSDARRSPLDRYRAPGTPAYDGA